MTSVRGFVALGFVCTAACAVGGQDVKDDGNSSDENLFPGYQLSRELTVAGSAPSGYSLSFVVDHATMVADGKSEESGADVRVFFQLGDSVTEIDRVLDPSSAWNLADTQIWFRTQDAPGRYHVVYSKPGAVTPPEDPTLVFEVFDGFDELQLTSGWIPQAINDMTPMAPPTTGTVTPLGGRIRLSVTAGGLGMSRDGFYFLMRPVQNVGDFVADVGIKDAGGELGDTAYIGGVMVRQAAADNSRHASIVLRKGPPREAVSVGRPDDSGISSEAGVLLTDAFPQFLAIHRKANLFDTFYWASGSRKMEKLGGTVLVNALTEPVLVGIPASNASTTADGWVEIDYFRMRKLVDPEPAVAVGGEHAN